MHDPVPAPRPSTLVLLPLLGSLTAAIGAQTTISIPVAADNTLYESTNGTVSNGSGIGFFTGRNGFGTRLRAVLRFDVASWVPAGATIVAAKLTIESQQSNDFATRTLTAHRVLQDWGEGASVAPMGGGGGTQAAPGDATWLHTFYNTSFWNTPGGDFAPASFAFDSPPVGIAESSYGPETVADVQFWLDFPAQNFGWLLLSDESLLPPTARRFASKQATSGQRPSLEVSYLEPGDVGTWGTGCPTTFGTFAFAWGAPMIAGTNVPMLHTDAPPSSIGVNYFALDLYQPGGLIQPNCNLYLPITQSWIPGLIFLTDAAGVGSPTAWSVPTIYPGLYFVTQSAVLDNSPVGLSVSNAGVAVIQ